MYLLYILCIGCIITGILQMRVYVCNSTDLLAVLEQTWRKNTYFLLQHRNPY